MTPTTAQRVDVAFRPSPKQAHFLQLPHRYKLLLAGYQFGKTLVLAWEMLQRVIDAAYWLDAHRSEHPYQSAMAVAIAPTNPMVKDILLPAYDQHLKGTPALARLLFGSEAVQVDPDTGEETVDYDAFYNQTDQVMRFPGLPFPITLRFRSTEKGTLRLAGLSRVVAVHGDEAALWGNLEPSVCDAIWVLLQNRVATMQALSPRLGNISLCTTPEGYDWTYKAFQEKAATGDPRFAFVHATSWENPHRSDEELAGLLQDTPPWLIDKTLLALRTNEGGSYFPTIRDYVSPDLIARPVLDSPAEVLWEPPRGWRADGSIGFVHGYDIALTGDFCFHIARTAEHPSNIVYMRLWHPLVPSNLLDHADLLQRRFPGREYWDQTGMGEGPVDARKTKGVPCVGVKFTAEAKHSLVTDYAIGVTEGRFLMPAWERFLREHGACNVASLKSQTRLEGSHFDMVMGSALCARGVSIPSGGIALLG